GRLRHPAFQRLHDLIAATHQGDLDAMVSGVLDGRISLSGPQLDTGQAGHGLADEIEVWLILIANRDFLPAGAEFHFRRVVHAPLGCLVAEAKTLLDRALVSLTNAGNRLTADQESMRILVILDPNDVWPGKPSCLDGSADVGRRRHLFEGNLHLRTPYEVGAEPGSRSK